MTNKKSKLLDIFSGELKPLILCNLSNGRKTISNIHKVAKDASYEILCKNLKELEKNNIVNKEYFYGYPPRVEYFLTSKGYKYTKLFNELEVL